MSDSTPQSESPPAGQPASTARSATSGLILITLAKVWFMVAAGALGLLLPRMFPRAVSAQRYGEWGIVLSWISTLNNVIVTGTIQMVSRFASRGPSWVEGSKRAALRVNLVFVTALALGFVLAAPSIAAFEKDGGIEDGLRLSAGVLVCYGLYAVFVGAANGAREFHKQAGLDMTFATLRSGCVLGAALVTGTLMGAIGGFLTAAAAILLVSVAVVGWRPAAERPATREMIAFAAPVAAYLLVQNLLMFVDAWLVKRYVAMAAESAGAAAAAASATASKAVGAYNAALQIARLPYQATLAVTFVIFPLISQSTFANDLARTRDYVRRAVRLSLIVVVAAAAGASARPDSIFLLLFPTNDQGVNEYLVGAAALTPLMFAYAGYSLLSIAGTILNGAGAAKVALGVGALTLALDVVANLGAIQWALATNHHPLQAAALATAASMIAGLVGSLAWLQRRFGASLSPLSAARVGLCAAGAIVVGRVLPLPGKAGLLACVVAAGVYVVLLGVSREMTLGELRALRRSR